MIIPPHLRRKDGSRGRPHKDPKGIVAGLNIQKTAGELECHPNTLSNVLRGVYSPSLSLANRIAALLQISPTDIEEIYARAHRRKRKPE